MVEVLTVSGQLVFVVDNVHTCIKLTVKNHKHVIELAVSVN